MANLPSAKAQLGQLAGNKELAVSLPTEGHNQRLLV